MRAEWGIGEGELVVGGVGRLVAEKGIRELGETARELAGRARFVWVGPTDPDKPDALDQEIAGVQAVGGRDDMAAVYNAFDIFVLPSYREGFSRSGMEAAATGLPLVLSDISGCREVGRHEQEALLVPAGDAGALTEAVRRLLDDPGLRERLGAAAQSPGARGVRPGAGGRALARDVRRRGPAQGARLVGRPRPVVVARGSRPCLAAGTGLPSGPSTSLRPRPGSWWRRRSWPGSRSRCAGRWGRPCCSASSGPGAAASRSSCSSSARCAPPWTARTPSAATPTGSPRSAGGCARGASTSCRSWSTCCAAR